MAAQTKRRMNERAHRWVCITIHKAMRMPLDHVIDQNPAGLTEKGEVSEKRDGYDARMLYTRDR